MDYGLNWMLDNGSVTLWYFFLLYLLPEWGFEMTGNRLGWSEKYNCFASLSGIRRSNKSYRSLRIVCAIFFLEQFYLCAKAFNSPRIFGVGWLKKTYVYIFLQIPHNWKVEWERWMHVQKYDNQGHVIRRNNNIFPSILMKGKAEMLANATKLRRFLSFELVVITSVRWKKEFENHKRNIRELQAANNKNCYVWCLNDKQKAAADPWRVSAMEMSAFPPNPRTSEKWTNIIFGAGRKSRQFWPKTIQTTNNNKLPNARRQQQVQRQNVSIESPA